MTHIFTLFLLNYLTVCSYILKGLTVMCYILYFWFRNFVHCAVLQSEHCLLVVFFGMWSNVAILWWSVGWWAKFNFLAWADFLLRLRQSEGPTPPSLQWVPGLNLLGHEADHWPPSSAEAFMVWTGITFFFFWWGWCVVIYLTMTRIYCPSQPFSQHSHFSFSSHLIYIYSLAVQLCRIFCLPFCCPKI